VEYQLTFWTVVMLLVSGLAAGFVNTLAGGGGLFTLSALMLMGIPADIANGTNRSASPPNRSRECAAFIVTMCWINLPSGQSCCQHSQAH
jgi:uncharacterized membrane protein YjjP (DUF1212 family)